MKKYRILHITKDDKFFDGVIKTFDKDNRIESRCVLINASKIPLKYIKLADRVRSVTVSELKKILTEGDYDAVYFHSIAESVWRIVLWIPKGKKIIWWSWGYDLYVSRLPYFRPLIPINLYKPLTRHYYEANNSKSDGSIKQLISIIKARYLEYCRRKALSRIDYFIPVIPEEYELLKKQHGFKAQLFAHPWTGNNVDFVKPSELRGTGKILFGNSASISNNHLDVWKTLKNAHLCERELVIPVSYGNPNYRDYLIKNISSNSNKIIFLQDLLPSNEYNKLLDECRYALFGVIRQQAVGNVNLCLQRGIKMFFYKDSMVYHYLKNMGCYVFSIEELDSHAISTPLTEEEAEHNFRVWSEYRNKCYQLYNSVINNLIEEI